MKKFKWKFEVIMEVTENWIEDGFTPSVSSIEGLLDDKILPWAEEGEKSFNVKFIEAPDSDELKKVKCPRFFIDRNGEAGNNV